jgi:predicted nucleic acid-binding protein
MGLTLLDAGVVIGFLDPQDVHHRSAHGALRAARERRDRIVLPASAYAEALVGPTRAGSESISIVDRLVVGLPIEIEPLGRDIAVAAARIRAKHPAIKLPDALVIASAGVLDADVLVTTDRGWPPRTRLGIRGTISKL